MFRSKSLPILAGAAALAVGSIALPAPSHATVFFVNSTNFGTTCSPNCGEITVTDNGSGVYSFDIDLTSALFLHNGSGSNQAIGFDLTGVTGIASGPVTALSTGTMFDGFGNYNFSVNCSAELPNSGNICSPDGQSPSNDLIFSVDAPSGQNIAVNGFIALRVADTNPSSSGNTGFAGTVVPAPLIGHGLLALLAVGGVLFGGKLLESLKNRRLHAA